TLVVEFDGGVPRRARSLLVGGEERVLERSDQRVAVDSLLALDRANRFDDLSRHVSYPSSIRLPRTMSSYGTSIASVCVRKVTVRAPAATTSPRRRRFASVRSETRRPTTLRKCCGVRSGRSVPGDETEMSHSRR